MPENLFCYDVRHQGEEGINGFFDDISIEICTFHGCIEC